MSSKAEILNRIKQHLRNDVHDMPELNDIEGITYPDLVVQFTNIIEAVGGNVIVLDDGVDINTLIRSSYPDAQSIASNLPSITIASVNPDEVEEPQSLNGVDLAIIEGTVGVAENGCIWIPQNVKEKVLYFISEHLIILLNKHSIVNNMHEAYQTITFNDYGFGVFISGPSKTADIEQALVIGAHGAKGLTVILKK